MSQFALEKLFILLAPFALRHIQSDRRLKPETEALIRLGGSRNRAMRLKAMQQLTARLQEVLRHDTSPESRVIQTILEGSGGSLQDNSPSDLANQVADEIMHRLRKEGLARKPKSNSKVKESQKKPKSIPEINIEDVRHLLLVPRSAPERTDRKTQSSLSQEIRAMIATVSFIHGDYKKLSQAAFHSGGPRTKNGPTLGRSWYNWESGRNKPVNVTDLVKWLELQVPLVLEHKKRLEQEPKAFTVKGPVSH